MQRSKGKKGNGWGVKMIAGDVNYSEEGLTPYMCLKNKTEVV
jgi:hypothetical protein